MPIRRLTSQQQAGLRAQARAGNVQALEALNSMFNEESIYGTIGARNLFVSPTGSDMFVGTTVGAPFRTIQAALNSLPKRIRHLVKINLAAGSYDGFDAQGFNIDADLPGEFAGISILGNYVQYVPATGTGSGILTSVTVGATATVTYTKLGDTTQNWPIDSLKGRFVHITLGTGIGTMLPILSNTATDFTIANVFSIGVIGGSYRIVDCDSVITTAVRTMPSLPTSTQTTTPVGALAGIHFVNNNSSRGSVCFRLEGIKMALTTVGAFTGINCQGIAALTIARCQIMPAVETSFTAISATGPGTLNIQQCYLDTGSTGVNLGATMTGTISNCFMKMRFPLVIGGGSGSHSISGTLMECPASSIGINLDGRPCHLSITGLKITGNQSQAIRIPTSNTSGHSIIAINGLHLSAGSVGIEILGPHYVNAISLTITAGATAGLDLYQGARFKFDTTSSISSVGGLTDIRLDGVVTTTAAIRALTPKVLNNAYGTVIYEG